jgi:hypothetical protein
MLMNNIEIISNNDKVHSSITSSREPFHEYRLLFKQIAWFNDNPYLYMLLRYTGGLLLKQTYHLLAYEPWKEDHCACKMGFSIYVKQIDNVCRYHKKKVSSLPVSTNIPVDVRNCNNMLVVFFVCFFFIERHFFTDKFCFDRFNFFL